MVSKKFLSEKHGISLSEARSAILFIRAGLSHNDAAKKSREMTKSGKREMNRAFLMQKHRISRAVFDRAEMISAMHKIPFGDAVSKVRKQEEE